METVQNLIDTLIPYLAGYFDGEGCVTLSRATEKKRVQLAISITSADKEVIELFAKAFGGECKPAKAMKNSRRALYHWAMYGRNAQGILKMLLPYLNAKRHPANLALLCKFGNQGSNKGQRPADSKIDAAEILVRDYVRDAVHSFNQRVTVN